MLNTAEQLKAIAKQVNANVKEVANLQHWHVAIDDSINFIMEILIPAANMQYVDTYVDDSGSRWYSYKLNGKFVEFTKSIGYYIFICQL